MSPPPVLASVWRGPICEARIRGHVAVVDAGGDLLTALGDPGVLTTLRSTVKPIQALPFVRRAVDELGAGSAEIAIACASHNGEPRHVEVVRRLLGTAGVDEDALACGPQPPMDPETGRQLSLAGLQPQRVHNNCSGKHAAMLATCAVAGWPQQGYQHPGHPCQQAVAAELGEALGIDIARAPQAVDGCSLPTYGVPLAALARAFATGTSDPAFRRCQDAMASHPFLVAGTGRSDTALLASAGGRVTTKVGAAGVWAAAVRPDGPGVAIKLEAGGGDSVPAIAIAVLIRLGALPAELPAGLAAFAHPALHNWAGETVGETRVEEPEIARL